MKSWLVLLSIIFSIVGSGVALGVSGLPYTPLTLSFQDNPYGPLGPVAAAGADQSVQVGATVNLNGGDSTHAAGDRLTYSWTLPTVPDGSNASLSDAATVSPSFTVDLAGEYIAELVVNDGTVNSAPDAVSIFAAGGGNAAPVGFWKLDEGAGTTASDSSENGHTGTLDNGTTWVPGQLSNAVKFDGANDRVRVANSADLNFDAGDNFSISFWFKDSTKGPTDTASPELLEKQGATGGFYQVRSPNTTTDLNTTGALRVQIDDGSNQDSFYTTAGDLADGIWHHVVVIREVGVGIRAYVDGNLAGSDSSQSAGSLANSGDLLFGSGNTSGDTYDGALDQVRIYRQALSTVEIDELFAEGSVNGGPVAEAGADQNVATGDLVTLDGSGSTNAVTYSWTLTKPINSTASLSDAAAVNPSFTPDLAGEYLAELVVNDGTLHSAPDTMSVVAGEVGNTACPGVIPGDGAAPQILRVTPEILPDNSLIFDFNIDLDGPGKAWIEYHPEGEASVVMSTALSEIEDAQHTLQVMRLRPDTTYCYQVFAAVGEPDGGVGPISDSFPGSFDSGPLPSGLEGSSFTRVSGQQTYDLTLLDFNDTDFSGLVAINNDAEVVWYYEHSSLPYAVAQDDDFHLVFGQLDGVKFQEIEPDGDLVREITDTLEDGTICSPAGRWHHESLLGPDERVYFLGSEIQSVEINGETRNQTGDTVVVWDRDTGTVETLASLFDLIDPKYDRTPASDVGSAGFFWNGCTFEGTSQDWTHSNSLWFGAEGNLIQSIRHLDQVISIAPGLETVQWRLGGPGSDFSFPEPSDRFYHQHSAIQLPNGNILLFDNGNGRPQSEGGEYSRALELELDLATMEARKVWEYRFTPDLYASCCSGVRRLANGNTVVDFGADFSNGVCCRTFTLVEANEAGETVSVVEIFSPGKSTQYRAYPISSMNGEFIKAEAKLVQEEAKQAEEEAKAEAKRAKADAEER